MAAMRALLDLLRGKLFRLDAGVEDHSGVDGSSSDHTSVTCDDPALTSLRGGATAKAGGGGGRSGAVREVCAQAAAVYIRSQRNLLQFGIAECDVRLHAVGSATTRLRSSRDWRKWNYSTDGSGGATSDESTSAAYRSLGRGGREKKRRGSMVRMARRVRVREEEMVDDNDDVGVSMDGCQSAATGCCDYPAYCRTISKPQSPTTAAPAAPAPAAMTRNRAIRGIAPALSDSQVRAASAEGLVRSTSDVEAGGAVISTPRSVRANATISLEPPVSNSSQFETWNTQLPRQAQDKHVGMMCVCVGVCGICRR